MPSIIKIVKQIPDVAVKEVIEWKQAIDQYKEKQEKSTTTKRRIGFEIPCLDNPQTSDRK